MKVTPTKLNRQRSLTGDIYESIGEGGGGGDSKVPN